MQTEIEAKFLSVNHNSVRKRLVEIGAVLKTSMQELRRVNMDFADKRLERKGGWVRIRTDGTNTTLTYKELTEWTLHGVKEVEVSVSDYEKTKQLLEALGLVARSYQVTKRETWEFEGTEIALDEWPWVKPCVEIEGDTEAAVQNVASLLGFDWTRVVFGSVEPVYMAEYDITEKEFYSLAEITFDLAVPDWLQARRRM